MQEKNTLNIVIFILLSVAVTVFSIFIVLAFINGKIVSYGLYAILVIVALTIFWLLVVFGLVGPSSWKNFVRGYITWRSTKTVLFFPFNPIKSVDESAKEGVRNFLPTKERIINWIIIKTVGIIFWTVLIVLTVVLFQFLK